MKWFDEDVALLTGAIGCAGMAAPLWVCPQQVMGVSPTHWASSRSAPHSHPAIAYASHQRIVQLNEHVKLHLGCVVYNTSKGSFIASPGAVFCLVMGFAESEEDV